ncbi:MAG: nucleotidyltransferase domain-containing protein [Candidatus Methanoperedens sp.]|nr:nucleotidyltransferase domain-containing protein [Candidatus Methanoperedens sp.]
MNSNMTGERIDYQFYQPLLAKLLDLIKDNYENRLISLILYGSVSRGTAKKDSDVDIILVVENLSYTEAMNRFLLVEDRLKESTEYLSIKSTGYSPEVKPIIFSREEASESRYIFLDVVNDGIILHDKNAFFKQRLEKLRKRLRDLESKRITREDGSWYWILAPNIKFGESFEI